METASIQGVVDRIGERTTFGVKETPKVELILRLDGKYPQFRKIDCIGGKMADDALRLRVGDTVDIEFELRGREWNGKIWNSDSARSIVVCRSAEPATPPADEPASEPVDATTDGAADAQDEMPF